MNTVDLGNHVNTVDLGNHVNTVDLGNHASTVDRSSKNQVLEVTGGRHQHHKIGAEVGMDIVIGMGVVAEMGVVPIGMVVREEVGMVGDEDTNVIQFRLHNIIFTSLNPSFHIYSHLFISFFS